MIDQSNLASRVLKPAAVAAGLGEDVVENGRRTARSWVGFHTLGHTAASVFFRAGWNAKQVQLVLGHHSPGFTLSTYVHLVPDDVPDADFLDDGWQQGANTTGRDEPNPQPSERGGFTLIDGKEPDAPKQAETAAAFS